MGTDDWENFSFKGYKVKERRGRKPFITQGILKLINEKHRFTRLYSNWPISYGTRLKA